MNEVSIETILAIIDPNNKKEMIKLYKEEIEIAQIYMKRNKEKKITEAVRLAGKKIDFYNRQIHSYKREKKPSMLTPEDPSYNSKEMEIETMLAISDPNDNKKMIKLYSDEITLIKIYINRRIQIINAAMTDSKEKNIAEIRLNACKKIKFYEAQINICKEKNRKKENPKKKPPTLDNSYYDWKEEYNQHCLEDIPTKTKHNEEPSEYLRIITGEDNALKIKRIHTKYHDYDDKALLNYAETNYEEAYKAWFTCAKLRHSIESEFPEIVDDAHTEAIRFAVKNGLYNLALFKWDSNINIEFTEPPTPEEFGIDPDFLKEKELRAKNAPGEQIKYYSTDNKNPNLFYSPPTTPIVTTTTSTHPNPAQNLPAHFNIDNTQEKTPNTPKPPSLFG